MNNQARQKPPYGFSPGQNGNSGPSAAGPGPARVPPQNFHKPAVKTRQNASTTVPYSADEAQRIQTQLNRVLGPEYVSCRPGGGGQNVSYIEGWKALNLANEIFGFNGWSSELISVQVDYLDSHGSGRVSLGLSVVVRITIRDGTFHEDFGYGNIDNAKNKAIAFEKCKKEAFTDALKRCLRCFGNVLGNCLYDKGIVAKMQKVKLPALELDWDDFHRDPLIVKREVDKQKKAADAERAASSTSNVHTYQNPASSTPTSVSSHNPSEVPSAPSTASTASSNNFNRSVPNQARDQAKQPSPIPANGVPSAPGFTAPKPGAITGVSSSRPGAATVLTPSMVKEYDLDDFDDSFVFSDDMPADASDQQQDTTSNKQSDIPDNPSVEHAKEGEIAPGQVFFTSSKKALDVQKESYKDGIPVYNHKPFASTYKPSVDLNRSAKVRRADVPAMHTPSQINASQNPSAVSGTSIGKRPLGMPPSQRPASKRLHKAGEQSEKENDVTA
ncbi:hypothetical protein OXX79_011513 [Metschnikowia pulcherrima]